MNSEKKVIGGRVLKQNKVSDPIVNDIKQLEFTADGTVYYKLAHDVAESIELSVRRLAPPSDPTLNQLYLEPRPIMRKKYAHLQQLKETVPKLFHASETKATRWRCKGRTKAHL